MNNDSFYMVGFIEYDVPGFENSVSTRNPNLIGFGIIKISYEDSFNRLVLAFSSYGFGNKGPTFTTIGAQPVYLRLTSPKSFVR